MPPMFVNDVDSKGASKSGGSGGGSGVGVAIRKHSRPTEVMTHIRCQRLHARESRLTLPLFRSGNSGQSLQPASAIGALVGATPTNLIL